MSFQRINVPIKFNGMQKHKVKHYIPIDDIKSKYNPMYYKMCDCTMWNFSSIILTCGCYHYTGYKYGVYKSYEYESLFEYV